MLRVSEFEYELERYARPYDRRIGKWWLRQTMDYSHRRAYKRVADHLRPILRKTSGLVIDYACGSGIMIEKLLNYNDRIRIIGLDGSIELLRIAKDRLSQMDDAKRNRVRLIMRDLPDFSMDIKADVIIFAFPNIVPTSNSQSYDHLVSSRDRQFLRFFSTAIDPEMESSKAPLDAEELREELLRNRAISRNLRSLLKKGGYCLRVEYAEARPREQTILSRQRSEFEAGYLQATIDGKYIDRFFTHVYTRYFNSKVIMDVYHQTGDKDDMVGGYWITLLKAR